MSKRLANTLQQPEALVEGIINKLEKLSGFSSHDLHFDSDTRQLLAKKTSQLALDPNDTSEEEFYWGLMHKFADANKYFEESYFGSCKAVAEKMSVVAGMANNSLVAENVWSLKTSTAKKLLRKNPPKTLMKPLGYRSLESMLKHEDALLILGVAMSISSVHWTQVTKAQIGKLTTADYEEKPQQVVVLDSKWVKLTNKMTVITNNSSAGLVVLSPNALAAEVPLLSLLVITAQNLESGRVHSVAARMPELNSASSPFVASFGGAAITWSSLVYHLGRLHQGDHPEILDPYIMPEHLMSRSISDRICSVHPVLNFWKDTGYLLKGHSTRQVSANIIDVATNFANNVSLGSNTTQAGRASYWNHLLHKYMQHPAVFDKILADIEGAFAPGYRQTDQMVPEYAEVRDS